MKVKVIFIFSFLALFAILILQNSTVVGLKFFFWKIEMSLIILIPITILLGIIIGFILAKVMDGGVKAKEKDPHPSARPTPPWP